jgi:hypothetical protein
LTEANRLSLWPRFINFINFCKAWR